MFWNREGVMETRYGKLLTMLQLVGGRLFGRKRFQKIVYILQAKEAPFEENFSYHYYGPYSSDLQLEIDNLVDKGLIKEEEPRDSSCYIYTIEEKIEEDASVAKFSDLIDLLRTATTDVLELTSTVYYLVDKGTVDKSILEKKLKTLKPSLQKSIPEAFKLYEEIESRCQ